MSTYGESDFELEESMGGGSMQELEESMAESVEEMGYSAQFEADESAIQDMQKSGYSVDFEQEESMASRGVGTPKSMGYSVDFEQEESVAASLASFKPGSSAKSMGYSADDFDEESMAASVASRRETGDFALQTATPKSMGYSADDFDEESIAASVASRRISPRAALSTASKNPPGSRSGNIRSQKHIEYSQTLDGYSTNFDADESLALSPKTGPISSNFNQSAATATDEYSQTFDDEYSQAFENDSVAFSDKGAPQSSSKTVSTWHVSFSKGRQAVCRIAEVLVVDLCDLEISFSHACYLLFHLHFANTTFQLKPLDVNQQQLPAGAVVNKQLGAALGVNSPIVLSESYSPTHSRLKAEVSILYTVHALAKRRMRLFSRAFSQVSVAREAASKSRQDQEALLAEKASLEVQMVQLQEEETRGATERKQEHDVHRQKMKSKKQRAEVRRQTHELALKASQLRVAELEETETFQSELLEQQTHELNVAKQEAEGLKKHMAVMRKETEAVAKHHSELVDTLRMQHTAEATSLKETVRMLSCCVLAEVCFGSTLALAFLKLVFVL
jgi:hypothetical protein